MWHHSKSIRLNRGKYSKCKSEPEEEDKGKKKKKNESDGYQIPPNPVYFTRQFDGNKDKLNKLFLA